MVDGHKRMAIEGWPLANERICIADSWPPGEEDEDEHVRNHEGPEEEEFFHLGGEEVELGNCRHHILFIVQSLLPGLYMLYDYVGRMDEMKLTWYDDGVTEGHGEEPGCLYYWLEAGWCLAVGELQAGDAEHDLPQGDDQVLGQQPQDADAVGCRQGEQLTAPRPCARVLKLAAKDEWHCIFWPVAPLGRIKLAFLSRSV